MKNKKIRIISAFLAVIFVLEALPLKAIAFNRLKSNSQKYPF